MILLKDHCIGIFYDFTKAFYLVNHDFLFEKLSQMGINGMPLDCIKSYLCNRKYFVQLKYIDENGNSIVYKSREREWNKVLQSSNLGPYLFLVMINDLPSHLCSEILSLFHNHKFILSVYADDFNSIISHKKWMFLKIYVLYQ
jgi:hypothetical protein